MKKLGKLSISPEKIMKNDELINLQGGYSDPPDDCTGTCHYSGGSGGGQVCNICKDLAKWLQANFGGYYCCDNCSGNYCGDHI